MRPLGRAALLLALALLAGASALAATTFKVTSRSLASFSIDAGRAEGLKVGDRLRVVAGETTVAEIEVVSVAERSASCRAVSAKRPIAVGDVVVAVPAAQPTARPQAPPAAPVPANAKPIAPSPTAPSTAVASPPAAAATAALPASSAPSTAVPAPSSAAPAQSSAAPAQSSAAPARSYAALAQSSAAPAQSSAAPPAQSSAAPAQSSAAPARASATTPAPRVETSPSASGRRFTVKYRSATSVYLDAGRAAGLDVGDRLRVVSGSDTVGELEVAYAAELSASCRVVSEKRPVRGGDTAVLLSSAPRPAAASPEPPAASAAQASPAPATAAPAADSSSAPSAPWARVRGSASIGYYRSWDETESDYDFEERTARLDLGVYDMGGKPLSFTLRGRSRKDVRARTLSVRTPEEERTDRLYEAALRYEPPSDRVGFEVGRIGIYRFVGIGYLDGALARFRPVSGLQVGAFGGRVAEIESLGLDGTGQKFGAFVQLAPGGRYAHGGYDVMLAFVRESVESEVSREYLSLESRFGKGSRWSIFQRAELELNTGWRKDVTGESAQLSNVSLSGNLRVASSAWAFVSYDGRRNYRYYQNRVVPEEVFDDLLHQGLRAGVNLARPGGFGATAGFGMSLKESDPRHPELDIANAYSANAGVRHADLFSSGFSVGIDGSGFTNGYTEGGLVMARVGRRFAAGHVLDLSVGGSFYTLKSSEEDRSTQWIRLLGRAELGWRVYLQGDFEYDSGDDLKGPRGALELGILF